MPRAVLYLTADDGRFLPVPDTVWITTRDARAMEPLYHATTVQLPDTDLHVHALWFDDGSHWSTTTGFRPATSPPPWAAEGLSPPAWYERQASRTDGGRRF